ncbi:MAG TPA: rod shape-determining protein MreC, partial [Patescibacteria group bacterium]|nr:rod shape-determining protein MreC [Patescibacteria group bacterium]
MPNKFLSPKLIKLLATTILCLLLVFLNPKGIFSPVKSIFWSISYPFQKTFYILSKKVQGTFDFLDSISDLKKENENLFRENNQLLAELAGLKDTKRINEDLENQLKLAPKGKFDLEAARVIGQDPQKLGSWIMIDKGSLQGVATEMPVIVSDGILIGKISEVYPNSSQVELLTSADSSINALDLETNAKGLIKGEYSLGIVLDMVEQSEILNVGDTVITSGLGSNIGRGLYIGTIVQIKTTEDRLFQEAIVSPRIKYSKLETVFVIKK